LVFPGTLLSQLLPQLTKSRTQRLHSPTCCHVVPSYPPLCTFHGFITQPVLLLPTQLPGSSSLSLPIQNVPHLPTLPASPSSHYLFTHTNNHPLHTPPRVLCYLEIAPLSPIPHLLQASQGQLWEEALAGQGLVQIRKLRCRAHPRVT